MATILLALRGWNGAGVGAIPDERKMRAGALVVERSRSLKFAIAGGAQIRERE